MCATAFGSNPNSSLTTNAENYPHYYGPEPEGAQDSSAGFLYGFGSREAIPLLTIAVVGGALYAFWK